MKIIIVGAGYSGGLLAEQLGDLGHEIVVIDKDKKAVDNITNRLSVNGVWGSGASRNVLLQAGAEMADILITMTPNDETNLLVCQLAKNSGTRRVVACINRTELMDDADYIKEKFSIDHILCPQRILAEMVTRQIYFPTTNRVLTLYDQRVLLAELTIEKGSVFEGKKLTDLKPSLNVEFLVVAVSRNGKAIIPQGSFVLKEGDIICVVTHNKEMMELLSDMGLITKPVKSVMIVGGGETGLIVSQHLSKLKLDIKIIENDRERCEELYEHLPKVDIVYGSGDDIKLLEEEKISKTDAFICLTNNDELNLLASLIAWSKGIKNIILKIRKASYEKVLRQVTINVSLSEDVLLAARIMDYVQSVKNLNRSEAGISRFFQFAGDLIMVSKLDITNSFGKVNIPLKSDKMKLKKNVLIAAIIRDGDMIIPKGSDVFKTGDSIIVFSEQTCSFTQASDILE